MPSDLNPTTPEPESLFTLHAHRPERGARRQDAVMLCCGCCCCCCCLHSVGSLVGAAVASGADKTALDHRTSAAPLYWLLLAVGGILAAVFGGPLLGAHSDASAGVWILALGLPAIQLGVSVVAALIIAVVPTYPDKGAYLASLAKITGGAIAGTVLGIVLMVVGCGVITGGGLFR